MIIITVINAKVGDPDRVLYTEGVLKLFVG